MSKLELVKPNGQPASSGDEKDGLAIRVSFDENGARISATEGITWNHYIETAALLTHAWNEHINELKWSAMLEAKATADVAAGLQAERQRRTDA